jgi:hypothetical protein
MTTEAAINHSRVSFPNQRRMRTGSANIATIPKYEKSA